MPTFDVIIPAYNTARFLPQALDSVIAQTFTDWRIVLVDDGSTDSTPELVRPYQARLGEQLLYVRQPNAGLPAARNTAIRHATAEYLALLDADDVWLPRRLELTLQRFRERPAAALVYGFVSRIDPQGRVIDTFDRAAPHAEGAVAPFLYKRMLDMPCPTISFRREAAIEAGMFDESLRASEDRDLWIRIAARHEVALVREVIALYRLSPQSMSTDVDRMTRSQLRLIEKHYGLPGCGWPARRVSLGWAYRQRAEALAAKGQLTPALKAVLKSLGYNPLHAQAWKTLAWVLLRPLRSSRPGAAAAPSE